MKIPVQSRRMTQSERCLIDHGLSRRALAAPLNWIRDDAKGPFGLSWSAAPLLRMRSPFPLPGSRALLFHCPGAVSRRRLYRSQIAAVFGWRGLNCPHGQSPEPIQTVSLSEHFEGNGEAFHRPVYKQYLQGYDKEILPHASPASKV